MLENPIRFYDDEGSEVSPDLTAKPSLSTSCSKDEDTSQQHLCAMNRLDQQDEDDFRCGAYTSKQE